MPAAATKIDNRVYKCRKCRHLSAVPEEEEVEVWYVMPDGYSVSFPGIGTIPLSYDVVPCPTHLRELKRAYPPD